MSARTSFTRSRLLTAASLLLCLGVSGCGWIERLFQKPSAGVTLTPPPPHQPPTPRPAPDSPPATPPAPPATPPSTPTSPPTPPVTPPSVPVKPLGPMQPPRPPTGAKAVVIGDSHTAGAAYSRGLHAALEGSFPGQVAYYGVCSATGEWWLTPTASRDNTNKCFLAAGPGQGVHVATTTAVSLPSVEELVALKPDLLIIALGTNRDSDPIKALEGFRDRLATADASLRCLWVGPPPLPLGRDQYLAAFYKLLDEKLKGRCRVLDSRPVMAGRPPSAPGGFHYGGAHAEHWAKAVVTEAASK